MLINLHMLCFRLKFLRNSFIVVLTWYFIQLLVTQPDRSAGSLGSHGMTVSHASKYKAEVNGDGVPGQTLQVAGAVKLTAGPLL